MGAERANCWTARANRPNVCSERACDWQLESPTPACDGSVGGIMQLGDEFPEALLVLDGGKIASVNARAAALLGAAPSELIGLAATEVIEPGELDRLTELERQQAVGWGPPETFRVRLLRRTGGDVLVDLRFGRTGDRLVLSARDMTETSRGEGLISRIAELAARADVDVIGFLKAAEPAFVELGWTLAYSLIEADRVVPTLVLGREDDPVTRYGRSVLGKRLDRASSPIASQVVETGRAVFLDNLPSTRAEPQRLAEQLDKRMTEARIRRSIWCPIWTGASVSAVLSVAGADLTDHDFVAMQLLAGQLGAIARNTRLQAELVRRERLAAMGETIAVVAHEARQPLAVLTTALPILAREQNLGEAGRAAVGMIDEEITRLRQMLGELREFSRPTEPQLTTVPLLELVDEVVAAEKSLHADSVRPETDIDRSIQVLSDRELLRRVLLNLVDNAMIHVPDGGAIRLKAEVAGESCRLQIYNDGTSIDAATGRRIFEPFFTTRPDGTGLGLFVVQHGVASMGGRVDLDATDSGVQFSVYLRTV